MLIFNISIFTILFVEFNKLKMKNMNLFDVTKKIAKKILPEVLLNNIKRKHYLKVLINFDLNEEKDLEVVKLLVEKKETVIDIGANIGVYSKFLSEYVGKDGRVFAFEPIKITYNFLKQNTKELNLINVVCYNSALSDSEGEVIMEIPSVTAGENFFRARIIKRNNSEQKYKTYKIQTRILDEIEEINSNNISFIKCDVEGHELAVLKGSRKTIMASKCSLLVEVNDDPAEDEDALSVFNFLIDLNYKPFWYDGKNLNNYKKGDISVNYFFLLEGQVNKLKKSGMNIL